MSLIILGKDNEAFTVINVWIQDFQNKSNNDLVPLLKAILNEDWDKLPKYDKFASTEKEIVTLEEINQMIKDDPSNTTVENQYQLFPFVPALLAIKIKNLDDLIKRKQDYENFAKAIKGDDGQYQILGMKIKKFNNVIQSQAWNIEEMADLVKYWRNIDLDFVDASTIDAQPWLFDNLPRPMSINDQAGLEKWLRVYGNYFKNFIDEKLEMPKKGNNKSLWKFHHFIPYITDKDFKIKELEFAP